MAASTVQKLPPEIRARVEEWLVEHHARRLTLDQIMERLDAQFGDQLGEAMPSRSAVGRHGQKVANMGERLRRSREMAEQLVAVAGPQLADGKSFQVLVQAFDSLVFDQIASLDGEQVLDPENLMFLARAIQSVTSARKTDADLHVRLKAEAAKEAAEVAETIGRSEGVSAATMAKIKAGILKGKE